MAAQALRGFAAGSAATNWEIAGMGRTLTFAAPVRSPGVRVARAALAMGAVFALSYLCVAVPREFGRVAPVWLANAALLALILRTSPRCWPELIAAGLLGNLAGNLLLRDPPLTSFALSICNAVEVGVMAAGLRAWLKQPFDPSRPGHLTVFVVLASGASLLAAALGSWALETLRGGPVLSEFVIWTLSDALGLIIVTPCLLILRNAPAYLRERPFGLRGAGALLLVAASAVAIFGQALVPLLFAAPVAMAVAAMTMEVLGAAAAVLLFTGIALAMTAAGFGPALVMPVPQAQKVILFQLYVAVCAVFSLVVAAQQIGRRRLDEALAAARDAAQRQAQRAQAAEEKMARREARYRQLAEHATDMILHLDLDQVILYASQACRRLGYEPEELVGRSSLELINPADRDRRAQLIAAALREEDLPPPGERDYRVRSKDGRWIWIEGSPSLVRDDQGAVIGLVSLLRDITERKEMEDRLARAVTEARAADAAKTEFLDNVSHELRTPLTAILGFSAMLSQDKGLTAPLQRYAGRIEVASRALLSTINDLLDLSSIEAGQMRIVRAPVRPVALAEATTDVLAPQAEAKGLAIAVADLGVPARVLADADRLRQALFNLISNAVKYTAQGNVTVQVGYDAAASTLSFSVIDTGPGIRDDDAPRLFKRFVRLDGAREGAGLGLAICKRVVEAMDGRVGVRPAPGGGSDFWFEVPAPVFVEDPVTGDRADDDSPLAGVRVLLAAEADERCRLRAMLEPLQVEVTEAADFPAACACAAQAPVDVILLDLSTSRAEASAAAEQIRSAAGPNQHTPIVALGVNAGSQRLRDPPIFCFNDYLEGPLTKENLKTTLGRWSL